MSDELWRYRKKEAREPMKITADKELEQFPGLSRAELDAVNELFTPYVFYRKKGVGREFWTSCCHAKQRYLGEDRTRTMTPEDREALWSGHNDSIYCPFCGRWAKLKCVGKIGRGEALEEYQPVVFLRASKDGQTIWAQGYWSRKEYAKENTDTLCAEPLYMPTVVYRFRPGEALYWEKGSSGWFREAKSFGVEPFRRNGLYSAVESYSVIGLERLKESFLRYIDVPGALRMLEPYNRSEKTAVLMRFLHLAAQYPQQVEMLLKMGLSNIVRDWVSYKKKNAAVLRWNETDPRKAFRLNGAELKEWIGSGGHTKTLVMRKILQKHHVPASISEAEQISLELDYDERNLREILKRAEQWHMEGKTVLRYLQRLRTGCRNGSYSRRLHTVLQIWKDYLDAAEENGVELWKKKNLLPEDLWTAHDAETKKQRERREEQQKKAAMEKAERDRAVWKKRTEEVREKYALEMDGLVIVAPECEQDILDEGKALCHCVGGYADRHRDGRTTILFLRRAEAPKESFLTIEMNGNRLVQIHGYRNEGLYSGKGRFAPDPKEVYKDWLEGWLKWLKAGSRRRKDGTPILPKLKKKKQAVSAA